MTTLSGIKEPAPKAMPNGEQHGLMKVTGNSVPFNDYKRFSEKDREKMKKMHADQSQIVKAVYVNTKDSSRRLPISYCMWDGDPILAYNFIPDQEYEVPKGLVDLVNSKKEKKRSGIVDKNGNPMMVDQDVPGEHRFVRAF